MARKDRMEADTTEFVNRVLDELPSRCVGNRERLCGRITTVVARAEHAYKWGEPEEEIFEKHVYDAAKTIGQRCLNGVGKDKDDRTECGLEAGTTGKLPFFGE